jgi:ribosomal protein S18 acetylase RimI-like enzyme
MAHVEEPQFRIARPGDAAAVASFHADSWRHNYRGAYSDAFLDGDVLADRLAVWTGRLNESDPRRCTILAEERSLVGFANTVFDDDPTWGALLDNLHVANGFRRRGIGTRLQAFYEACGGRCVGRDLATPPGGIASRLTGSPARLRYAWTDPAVLIGPP